jgi:hypothetical protein
MERRPLSDYHHDIVAIILDICAVRRASISICSMIAPAEARDMFARCYLQFAGFAYLLQVSSKNLVNKRCDCLSQDHAQRAY